MENMELNANLKQCTACGNMIAKTAKTCPSCGAKVKQPIYKSKLLWFVGILALIICFTSISNAVKNAGKGVVIGGEKFSISEFKKIASENSNLFKSEYVGKSVTVTGKITKIESAHTQTNLGKTFAAVVVIEDEWHFEVNADNPILKQAKVGDKVEAKGTITTDLYGEVYCFGDANIRLK